MLGIRRVNRGGHLILPSVQRPLSRVELHVHIDGSIRHETVFELAKEKGIALPGRGSFEELVDYLVVKQPGDLASFLKRFDIILAVLKGDVKSVERLAYEFVEDCARSGIVYAEARFCPHILVPDDVIARGKENDEETRKWLWDVTGALIKGLRRGKVDFGSHVTLIATVIRGYSKLWYDETLELLADQSFHDGWIVGLDIAALPDTSCEKTHMMGTEAVEAFEEAMKLGIHRTVHAGESGGAAQVTNAIDVLHAERIGHGYRIISDNDVFNRVKKDGVHLECCPWSSLLTGSIHIGQHPHPIVKFFEEGLNVSINTDDPTVTGTRLDDEFSLLSRWGLSEAHFVKASFNAARSCFLPPNEKADLIQTIGKVVGAVL